MKKFTVESSLTLTKIPYDYCILNDKEIKLEDGLVSIDHPALTFTDKDYPVTLEGEIVDRYIGHHKEVLRMGELEVNEKVSLALLLLTLLGTLGKVLIEHESKKVDGKNINTLHVKVETKK